MDGKYILEDGEVKPEPDLFVWAEWFEKNERCIDKTETDKYLISTVFLGIDHSFGVQGPPILFETMVFKHGDWDSGSLKDNDMMRYATIDEARVGHKTMVAKWRA